MEMSYHQKNKRRLQPKDIEVLQNIILYAHDANNDIARDEARELVSKIYKCYDYSECEQG